MYLVIYRWTPSEAGGKQCQTGKIREKHAALKHLDER
jgi:hypothetical protein